MLIQFLHTTTQHWHSLRKYYPQCKSIFITIHSKATVSVVSVVLSVGCGCVKAVVMISGPIVTQSPGARQHQTRHSGHSRDSLLLPNYSSSAQPPHNSHHCPQLKTKLYALQILFQGVNCTINKAEKLMNLLRSVWFLLTVVYWLFWNVEI